MAGEAAVVGTGVGGSGVTPPISTSIKSSATPGCDGDARCWLFTLAPAALSSSTAVAVAGIGLVTETFTAEDLAALAFLPRETGRDVEVEKDGSDLKGSGRTQEASFMVLAQSSALNLTGCAVCGDGGAGDAS